MQKVDSAGQVLATLVSVWWQRDKSGEQNAAKRQGKALLG